MNKSKPLAGLQSVGPYRLTPERMGGICLPRSEGKGYEITESKDNERKLVHPALLGTPHLALAFGGFTPLPAQLRAKLKYVSYVLLSSGVTPGLNVYSANGLYDPDITGTGHQPRGFDQLIALYDHYVVMKSKCVVEFMGSSGASNLGQVGGVQLQSSSTAQSDYIDYAEQARCLFGITPRTLTSGGLTEPLRHEMHFDAHSFMGIPDPISATKLQGTVAANPSDQAFYHVFAQTIDGSTSGSQYALVSIEYDAVFFEPVPVASS
jgi:hypothetical protein